MRTSTHSTFRKQVPQGSRVGLTATGMWIEHTGQCLRTTELDSVRQCKTDCRAKKGSSQKGESSHTDCARGGHPRRGAENLPAQHSQQSVMHPAWGDAPPGAPLLLMCPPRQIRPNPCPQGSHWALRSDQSGLTRQAVLRLTELVALPLWRRLMTCLLSWMLGQMLSWQRAPAPRWW